MLIQIIPTQRLHSILRRYIKQLSTLPCQLSPISGECLKQGVGEESKVFGLRDLTMFARVWQGERAQHVYLYCHQTQILTLALLFMSSKTSLSFLNLGCEKVKLSSADNHTVMSLKDTDKTKRGPTGNKISPTARLALQND